MNKPMKQLIAALGASMFLSTAAPAAPQGNAAYAPNLKDYAPTTCPPDMPEENITLQDKERIAATSGCFPVGDEGAKAAKRYAAGECYTNNVPCFTPATPNRKPTP